MRTPAFLLFTCVLCSTAVSGRGENLTVRSYTVAEGLAHDHVSRIYRDSHGFLWICTDEGLSRFDGHAFVNYTAESGLPHIHVNDIVETRGGDYWVATDGGVTLFRPGHASQKFRTYKPEGPPQALFTNAVAEEASGAVLVGTAAGLYRLYPNDGSARLERIEFGAPPDYHHGYSVNTLYIDRNGTLWVGAVSGLYRRDTRGTWLRLASQDGLPFDFVHRIVADTAGRIWICTRFGLARLAQPLQPGKPAVDMTLTDKNGLPHRDVRDILVSPDGRRWICTLGGLVEWRPESPTPLVFRVYASGNGLTDPEVYAIETDPDGNIWIGTRRGGLMRLSRMGFQTFRETEGIMLSGEDSIVETRTGAICIAAILDPRRSIRCFDGRRFNPTVPLLPTPGYDRRLPSRSQSTVVDHLGDWWISTAIGLFRFRSLTGGEPGATADLRLLPARESRHLYEDAHGDLWITTLSTENFGLVRWERATSQLHDYFDKAPLLARDRSFSALAEAPDGQVWMGLSRPGGLYRWRKGRIEETPGAPEGTIEALYRDGTGRLWMASAEAGLGRIDDPAAERVNIRLYNRASGLASNEIWCLTEDRLGRIYAGTSRGVDRLDPATGRITHYSHTDGLTSGDIRAAMRDRRGDLWFLSNRGLSRLHPVQEPTQRPVEARITGMRVAGAPQPISEIGEMNVAPAGFEWSRNSVEIQFSAVDFQSPETLRYQFRLEGAAGEWSEPTPERTVRFANLAPGHYRFLVRALQPDGTASPKLASFAFTIRPAPWRQWWFETIAVGILLGLAYTWHRSRLNRQLALERVRSLIATDLHDDIGASLARIAVMSEAMKERVSAADGDSQRMLGQIAEASRTVVEGMSNIVWSIDPRRDNVADVVARLRAFGSDVLEPAGIRWICEDASGGPKKELSPDQRRQMYLIFKEAIHNVARHSGARNVTLRIHVQDNYVYGEIQDDGRGVTSDAGPGLGIGSMTARAGRLGGEFRISARPEGGTRATVRFPLS